MPGSRVWFGHTCMVGQGVEDSLLAVWKSGMTFANAEIVTRERVSQALKSSVSMPG